MKKIYENLVVKIVTLENDAIATSGPDTDSDTLIKYPWWQSNIMA